ncbi:MAG TPA: aldose 1-epimerase family protein [Syntrophomonas sp.]|nr:aldose 1-epimerase family protein [Syntrophomonas sp.]
MGFIYGKNLSKQEIMRRVGDITQIAGAVSARLDDGRGDGTRIINVKTGSGLNFTVVPGRGMDICSLDYCGYACSFVSKTGLVNAAYYETDFDGFHRSFFAGMLTTCGLRNIGASCTDQDEFLGLHGRISNIPAQDVCITNEWIDDTLVMQLRGMVRESKLYGENMTLTREITARLGENTVRIHDEVENCGFETQPFTILYHCNFGYPLLDENSYLVLPDCQVTPRDDAARQQIDKHCSFQAPENHFPETVFFLKTDSDKDGNTYAAIFNPELGLHGLGLVITYNQKNLPYLVQWKNMGNGDYVVALEPSNCYPQGRKEIRENKMLQYLAPGEIRRFDLAFHVVTSREELDALCFDRP